MSGVCIDVRRFVLENVADTCAVWNVLSSLTLYAAARAASCRFRITAYVEYECLRDRSQREEGDEEILQRFRAWRQEGLWPVHSLEVDDLFDIELLEQRRRLGKGELSSMVLARKLGAAVLTDDQKGRRLAECYLGSPRLVQTTPHLFGWLLFEGRLADSDKDAVIKEHNKVGRPLEPFFERIFMKALEMKLATRTGMCPPP
ncbi:MAG: hypothetical protein ABIO70_28360 [Pseudomonadota bacterium]